MTTESKLSREDAMRLTWPTDADPRDYPGTYEYHPSMGELSDVQKKVHDAYKASRSETK